MAELDSLAATGDLNADIFEDCILACQGGQDFSSKYREPRQGGGFTWKPAVTTKVKCADPASVGSVAAASYNYYSSGLELKNGEEITIALVDNPFTDGIVN